MRKVCPQCGGKGEVQVNLGGLLINGVACLDCDKTGYIEVEEVEDTEATTNTEN